MEQPSDAAAWQPACAAPQMEREVGFLCFASVCISLFVYVVRPGEIFPALASLRPGLVSFALAALAFFACGGLQSVRRMAPAGAGRIKLFLLLGLVGVPFSVYAGQALSTWGLVLIQGALYFCWLPAVESGARLRQIPIALTLCAACLVLAMLFQGVITVGADSDRVSAGGTYDPNDIAMVLATLLPFTAYWFFQGGWRGKLLCGLLAGGSMLGILKTGSRGGVLALGVAGLLFIFARGGPVKFWHKLFMVVLAAGFFMSPAADVVKTRWQEISSGQDYNLDASEQTGSGRLVLWKRALELIAERPLTGVGMGDAAVALGMRFHNWHTAHNSYLQAGLELGVPGLVVYLLLLSTIWRNCREARRVFSGHQHSESLALLATCTTIALAAYAVAGLFLSQAYSIMVPILLLISNGLVHAAMTMDDSPDGLDPCAEQRVEGA